MRPPETETMREIFVDTKEDTVFLLRLDEGGNTEILVKKWDELR